ncbi:hypothetical protein HOG48_05880 [Candidatus Peregrinibacteria bacterium]|jgi:hypothetical protein|nr:hypothetical protein [Candidatus Peregrinibacteria bacterium]
MKNKNKFLAISAILILVTSIIVGLVITADDDLTGRVKVLRNRSGILEKMGNLPSENREEVMKNAPYYAGPSDNSAVEILDTDGDGLIDEKEIFFGSDINNPDTDGDGQGDLMEYINATDPNDPCSPNACAQEVPVVEISPASLPILSNYSDEYNPIFRLQFTNTTGDSQSISYMEAEMANWVNTISTSYINNSISILNQAQEEIGLFDYSALSWPGAPDWLIVPDATDGGAIIDLDPYESEIVTVVWHNSFYPKLELQVESLPIMIGDGNTSTNITVNAYMPGNVLLGYRTGLLNNEMPSNENTEAISFVVNQGLVDIYPDWESNAKDLIYAYNEVLNENTGKELEIGQSIILNDVNDVCNVHDHPEYFLPNDGYGGMTIFYMVDPGPITCSLFFNGSVTEIDGVNYGIVYMIVGAFPNENYPNLNSLGNLIHESGHAYGLGVPEWYNYTVNSGDPVEDITGVRPYLGEYIPPFLEDLDEPMINAIVGDTYSDLNAFLISHNWNHMYTPGHITNLFMPDEVRVQVLNKYGKPVNDAMVEIYGMRTNGFSQNLFGGYPGTQPLLGTLLTDGDGEAILSLTSTNQASGALSNNLADVEFLVKAVKVSKNGEYAGEYYSTIDLLHSTLIEGENIHEISLTLQ